MPSIVPKKRGLASLVINPIFINLAFGAIPGMKIEGDIFGFFNNNTIGKERIKALQKHRRSYSGSNSEIRYLMEGMNTSICPSRGNEGDRFPHHDLYLFLDSPLYGRPTNLALPSKIAGSVIGNNQFYVSFLSTIYHSVFPITEAMALAILDKKRKANSLPF